MSGEGAGFRWELEDDARFRRVHLAGGRAPSGPLPPEVSP